MIDLGSDHTLKPITTPVTGDLVLGYVATHLSLKNLGETCGLTIWLHIAPDNVSPDGKRGTVNPLNVGNSPEWSVGQEDPLTLIPSVLCATCGDHGWVVDGKWFAAVEEVEPNDGPQRRTAEEYAADMALPVDPWSNEAMYQAAEALGVDDEDDEDGG